jgi:hypothetical protein
MAKSSRNSQHSMILLKSASMYSGWLFTTDVIEEKMADGDRAVYASSCIPLSLLLWEMSNCLDQIFSKIAIVFHIFKLPFASSSARIVWKRDKLNLAGQGRLKNKLTDYNRKVSPGARQSLDQEPQLSSLNCGRWPSPISSLGHSFNHRFVYGSVDSSWFPALAAHNTSALMDWNGTHAGYTTRRCESIVPTCFLA